ncbi:hypothetical protein EYF80_003476 [Liparis tanakae]|uniref:Uncharacterized protein n=1 Tax=Liparis tanakae TaxID=230148 RepID=A0A4Z2J901_9TELE|nr:hypothetical protein EYF80_003476 [Liparis tanakae]
MTSESSTNMEEATAISLAVTEENGFSIKFQIFFRVDPKAKLSNSTSFSSISSLTTDRHRSISADIPILKTADQMSSHLRELSDVSTAARRNGDDAPAECRQSERSMRGSSRSEVLPDIWISSWYTMMSWGSFRLLASVTTSEPVDAAEHVKLRVNPVQPAFDQICEDKARTSTETYSAITEQVVSPEDHMPIKVCIQSHRVPLLLHNLSVLLPLQTQTTYITPSTSSSHTQLAGMHDEFPHWNSLGPQEVGAHSTSSEPSPQSSSPLHTKLREMQRPLAHVNSFGAQIIILQISAPTYPF